MNPTDTLTLFGAVPLLATGFGVVVTGLLGCWLASGLTSLVRPTSPERTFGAEAWDDALWADEAFAL